MRLRSGPHFQPVHKFLRTCLHVFMCYFMDFNLPDFII